MSHKKIFFTSDWHIAHEKVIEYDQRPFRDINHMHTYLVDQYNSTVPEDGLCYFLGDMGLGNKDLVLPVMKRLNKSRKICIMGNHDKSKGFLESLGFDLVLNAAMFTLGKHNVTMSHCPLRGVWRESQANKDGTKKHNMSEFENWHGEWRHYAYSLPDFGQFHLHGHTHKTPEERILGRQMDVGVRANNYRPISISVIESWIAKYKGD